MLSAYSLERGPSQHLRLIQGGEGSITPSALGPELAALRSRIIEIHELFRPRLTVTGIYEYLQSRDEGDLSPEVRTKLALLRTDMQVNLIDKITSPEAQEILRDRKRRIEEADKVAANQVVKKKKKVAIRTEQFKEDKQEDEGDILMFDVDGTLTNTTAQAKAGYPRVNHEDPLLLGSGLFDTLMREDSSLRPILHAVGWGELIADYPEVYEEAGLYIPLREGITELFDYVREKGARASLLTTNFRPLIKSLKSRIPGAESASVYAIDAKSVISTLKGAIIRLIAVQNPNRRIHFFGDGESDRDVFGAEDQLHGIHTLRGSSLDMLARERGIEHFTFSDGFEIIRNLERIAALSAA